MGIVWVAVKELHLSYYTGTPYYVIYIYIYIYMYVYTHCGLVKFEFQNGNLLLVWSWKGAQALAGLEVSTNPKP